MQVKKQLTEQEFDLIRPRLSRYKASNIQGLYQILVKGKKQVDVAHQLAVSSNAISRLVNKAWLLHIKHGQRPKGWVSISVTLPPELAEMVKHMEQKAREDLKKGTS